MIRFGTLLAFLGFGSAILHFTSMQFRLLMWAEPMQPLLGLGIGGLPTGVSSPPTLAP